MKIESTPIKGLITIEPKVHRDDRGYFYESYNKKKLPEELRIYDWVQDNESQSTRGVLRGLHYQTGRHAQAKLVRAITGEIYDVAVDLRRTSKTYGEWYGILLNDVNKKQLLIPRGFAHGFVVLSETAIFGYKCDNFYDKESEGGIVYNDKKLSIDWPIDLNEVQVSEKDGLLPAFGKHKHF